VKLADSPEGKIYLLATNFIVEGFGVISEYTVTGILIEHVFYSKVSTTD
tara:strand:- start:622 stop:768 length:147 start_codon:yes stop_codon:yes gene_type:complete